MIRRIMGVRAGIGPLASMLVIAPAAAAGQAGPLDAAGGAAPAAAHGLTAEQAMANYQAMVRAPDAEAAGSCPEGVSGEITVCARRMRTPPRLPLPDERADAGEVVRHPGEARQAASAFDGGPSAPNRLPQTVGKIVSLLKSAATGEDPGF